MVKPKSFMLIAGEASGDLLAAELVAALKNSPELKASPSPPEFFGAGGPKLAAAGVELAFDLTQHSVIGLWEALKNYFKFKRFFDQLLRLACERRPDVIICVDFSGFNRRFAAAVRARVRSRRGGDWNPRIIQYVSPQVWASRPGRAKQMARDYDLLLVIFPFEKVWYAEHAPGLRVEFVGHPICERFEVQSPKLKGQGATPTILRLPGSRVGALKRHLPVMFAAAEMVLRASREVSFRMILPNEALRDLVTIPGVLAPILRVEVGGLAAALTDADVAVASTGTVTLECAYFGVPTVAIYKTSWSTYAIGKRIIQVKYLAMPNLLADAPIFPELIQDAATGENIAHAASELLSRRESIRSKLAKVAASLGAPGASARAAQAIRQLLTAPSTGGT